jgi:hypothetical protein
MKYFFIIEKNKGNIGDEFPELYNSEESATKEARDTWDHLTAEEKKKKEIIAGYADLPEKIADLTEYQKSLLDFEDLPENISEWNDADILGVILDYDIIEEFK